MNVLQDMLGSKKFIATVLASVLAFGGFALGFSVEMIGVIVSPLGVYTVSQGIADIGKEKAKAEQL